MIFSPSAIAKIESGQKTATTRKSTWFYKKILAKIDAGLPVYDCIKLGRSKALGWIRITDCNILKMSSSDKYPPTDNPYVTLLLHSHKYCKEEGFHNYHALYTRFLELKLDKALAKQGELYFYRFEYIGKERPK